MGRPTKALISLEALTHNWNLLSNHSSKKSFVIPVLKANAYGHGAVPLALHFQNLGVKSCAVALVEEAIELRTAGYKNTIYLLGPFLEDQIQDIVSNSITPFICNLNSLNLLAQSKLILSPLDIHLKFDTGMNRLGLKETDIQKVFSILSENKNKLILKGICSHFFRGDNLHLKNETSHQQLLRFESITKTFKTWSQQQDPNSTSNLLCHISNSDGFLRNIESKLIPEEFGSRLGLALYGYSAVDEGLATQLKPVMKLTSSIVHINSIKKGETVSYNGTWTAQQDSTIAVIPMGYADGYRRLLSNKGRVLVRGQIVNVVGTVCMDYFMIDVTQLHQHSRINLGEEVEIWGNNINLKQLASSIETIPYELLTTLSLRVPREYKNF